MKKITNIICLDNVKSRVVLCYFLLLAVISWTSLLLQDNEAKGALTILNITLFIVPLMSLLYTVTYLYDSRAFIVLLLSQPVQPSSTEGQPLPPLGETGSELPQSGAQPAPTTMSRLRVQPKYQTALNQPPG